MGTVPRLDLVENFCFLNVGKIQYFWFLYDLPEKFLHGFQCVLFIKTTSLKSVNALKISHVVMIRLLAAQTEM